MKYFKRSCIILAVFMWMILSSCSGGGDGGTGTLSMNLTDAPTDQYKAVYITIVDAQVHNADWEEDVWESVSSDILPGTFDLLELVNGVTEEIGLADLETGAYTQMRLIIGTDQYGGVNILDEIHPLANYVIDSVNAYHELTIPSGIQTGIKLVRGFNINLDQTTELLLDFIVEKSIVVAGNSGKLLLKPTIKVSPTPELTIIKGKVLEGGEGISNALVSVQEFDGTVGLKNQMIIHTSTNTSSIEGEEGNFKIFVYPLESGQMYNLVITSPGKDPAYIEITDLIEGQILDYSDPGIEFFTATENRKVTGTVSITDGDPDQIVSLSFRQDKGNGEMIEITSALISNGTTFTVTLLPGGEYSVVAWTSGYDTQTIPLLTIPDLDNPELDPIVQDINFPLPSS